MRHVITLVLTFMVVAQVQMGWAQGAPDLAVVSVPLPAVDSSGRAVPAAGKAPLAEMLTKAGEKFTDVTAAVRSGKLDFAQVKVLMIGSGALSADGARIANVLSDGKKLVTGFVEAGGVLVLFTDTNDAGELRFLPDTMAVRIESVAHDRRLPPSPEHPLLVGRHRLTAGDLGSRSGMLYRGGCFGSYDGLMAVVAWDARGRYPLVLEGSAGKGRVILIHLSPDRAFLLGTADEKVSATLLVENLLSYLQKVRVGTAPEVTLTERVLRGVVFEDADGDGRKGAGEKTHPRAEVTDGAALVKTDAQGRYSLPLDVYSEFVWLHADFAKYKGPLWRRIRPGESRLDIGLVRRETPFGHTPRIVYLVDFGRDVKPTDKTDPELIFMLGEIARLERKADVLVICGDAPACELRAEILRKHPPPCEVIHGFVPTSGAEDVIAERDAFRRALGPCPVRLVLGSSGFGVLQSQVLRWLRAVDVTPSFRKRGLKSPAGFFVLPWRTEFVPEFHLAGFSRLLHPIHPGLEATVAPGPLSVSFVLADTSSLGPYIPIKVEMAHVRQERDRLALVELRLPGYDVLNRGRFTREVVFKEPVVLEAGFYVMRFTAGPPRTSWSRNVSFVVPKEPLPGKVPGTPWPVPGGNNHHTGDAKDTVVPPLYLASRANVGARVLCGSPVVLGDEVLVPCEPRLSQFFPVPKVPQVRPMRFPFRHHSQGLFELHADWIGLETAEKPPRTFRFDFPGRGPGLATSHMAIGGEFLCVIDAKGAAWGFVRTRAAEVRDEKYDAKVAAESLRWRVKISPGCRQAVATDAALFTGNECVEIVSGKVNWKLEKYPLRDCRVALSGGHLVVAGVAADETSARQMVLVAERETGRLIWEKVLAEVHPHDEVMTAPPAVARGAVFIGSADGILRAFSLAEGAELWQFKTGASVIPVSTGPDRTSGRISSGAVISGRTVFFGAADGKIYALDRRKGTVKWSYNVGIPIVASPALSGNTLYVADWDGNLYTFVSLVEKRSR